MAVQMIFEGCMHVDIGPLKTQVIANYCIGNDETPTSSILTSEISQAYDSLLRCVGRENIDLQDHKNSAKTDSNLTRILYQVNFSLFDSCSLWQFFASRLLSLLQKQLQSEVANERIFSAVSHKAQGRTTFEQNARISKNFGAVTKWLF